MGKDDPILKHKIFRFLLPLLCICMLLTSCNGGGNPTETEAPITTVTEESTEPLRLIENGKSRYEIVFSEQADPAANTAAGKLRSLFLAKTGITLPMTDDYLKEGTNHDADACKILVGRTNYAASQALSAKMKYHDWTVAVDGTHLVIVAFHDAGYDAALNYLEKEVLSGMTGEVGKQTLTMKAETTRGSLGSDYEIQSWSIAGNDMGLYRIVYSGDEMRTYAETLRTSLAARTGYCLDIVQDSKSDPAEFEILMGNTNRTESAQVDDPTYLEYVLQVVGKKLVVKTGGEQSLKNLFRDFVVIAAADADTVTMSKNYQVFGDYYSDPYDTSVAKGSDLRVMSVNIMAEWESYGGGQSPVSTRKEIFFSALDYYQPTVVGLQEFSPSFYTTMETEYRDAAKWDILKFDNPNVAGEYVASTVMYRKDLYTLVDSGMQYYSKYNNGRCRCITWAVLKDAEGKEFCFVSTHWDGDNQANAPTQLAEMVAFVNEMAKTYPVITTGDFNSNEWTNSFKNLLSQTNSVEAKYAAEVALNSIGSWHEFGKDTPSAGSADHITVTKNDIKVLKFETMMYNEQIYCSDHAWLFADLQFKA